MAPPQKKILATPLLLTGNRERETVSKDCQRLCSQAISGTGVSRNACLVARRHPRTWYVVGRHRDLVICPNQVNLRKDRFPGQRGREILQSWHRVAIINRDSVQPTVVAERTPTPARFRNDVEGRRPRAARSSDDSHSFHLIKLLFSIGELLRRQSASSGEYGRTLRQYHMWCSTPCLGVAIENVGHVSAGRSSISLSKS